MEIPSVVELSKEKYKLRRYTQAVYDQLMFAHKLGKRCNANKSVPFTHADCDLESIFYDCGDSSEQVMGKDAIHCEFGMLFKKGFDELRKVFSDSVKNEDFDEPTRNALLTLLKFLKNKKNHEKSLVKVLKCKQVPETDIVAVTAEHLLSKLCPENSYFIDNRTKVKESRKIDEPIKCRCGCETIMKCAGTGIGNEHFWHGYVDIIFESHGDISCGASSAKRLKIDTEDDHSDEDEDLCEDSPGDENGVEENQAAAQAIVFSILQKHRHPDFKNHLIPFTAISNSAAKIYMYDSKNDILFIGQELPIFMELQTEVLEPNTIITLWMILHYKYFCSGLDLSNLSIKLEDVKAGFEKYFDHYSSIKSCVSSFPNVEKPKLVSCCKYNVHSVSMLKQVDKFLENK